MNREQRAREILERIDNLPEDIWRACPACDTLVHRDQLRANGSVCPNCGHHFRLSGQERIDALVDTGSFDEIDGDRVAGDPLDFVDRIPYPQRLARSRKRSGATDAARFGTARLDGHPIVLVVLDFGFLGGSMGTVVGEKVAAAAESATADRVPLVAVSASGGARMQEGIFSLLQMSQTSAAIGRLREAGVPFVSVLTDPVYGGVAASFAALGDVIIAEKGTRAGFAGPQVIGQTIRQELPPGFQTAEFLREHGHVDVLAERGELAAVLRRLVAVFAAAHRSPQPGAEHPPAHPRPDADAWETVRMARHVERPNALGYIDRIFTGFLPLHGDRWSEDDQAVVGGFAWLDDAPVLVVGHCKGAGTADNVRRNFGMPHPSGYRKVMRLYALAERVGVPVVTLVDTPGAYPGIRAEEGNQSHAIAATLEMSARLRVPLLSVIVGEGGSGGALALATGDRTLIQENGIYSVISPEGCATILFGDAARAPDAARALRLQASDLHQLGVVDELVPEPAGGAHLDPEQAAAWLSMTVRHNLAELCALDHDALLHRRHCRLRRTGWPELPSQDATRQHSSPQQRETEDVHV